MGRRDEAVRWLVCRLSVALVVALALAPLVRDITAGLTSTVGEAWPFSLEHCRSGDTPGCRFAASGTANRRLAQR